MAVFTDIVGVDVVRILSRCVSAVVALHAISVDIGMVERRRYPGQWRVAGIAFERRLNVIGVFAGGDRSVMALGTTALYVVVIHHRHRAPEVRHMTVFAHVVRINVHRTFPRCGGPVMAGGTVIHYSFVGEGRRYPGESGMTGIALLCCGNVRGILARSNIVVMTGGATAHHMGVVDHAGWLPELSGMAVFAHIIGLDMIG